MCGICGKLITGSIPVDEGVLRKMTSALTHRGPDDEGIYLNTVKSSLHSGVSMGLGHRRLSIIDLSEAGRQPMSNEDKSIWMVFNGEIYNFQSLRKELETNGHHFSSQTDCETIIHLYEEDGVEVVKKLVGMFAFAIWDEKKQVLLLARDHTGIKPLVYSFHKGNISFASEIKAILKDPAISKDIDREAIELYLTFNYIPAPYTIYKSVRKLKPGHILVWQKGEIREDAYWNINSISSTTSDREKDPERWKEALFQSLNETVRMQLISDVPLGAFLSGGIDSSIIVGLMARNSSRPVKTYTIGYADMPLFDETAYAREVASLYQTDHHEIILTSKDIISAIPNVLHSFDEPFGDSSAVPTFIVSRETGRDVKVALSGDGGDELFAGYRMYRGENWYSLYSTVPWFMRRKIIEPLVLSLPESRDEKRTEYTRRVRKFIRGAKDTFAERFFSWNEIFPRELREKLLTSTEAIDHNLGLKRLAGRLNEYQSDHVNRMLYADFKESLPGDMLTKVDAMSMQHSLEVRVPLLDHRMCELAFSIPGNWKIMKGKNKYIFIETFKNILPRSLLHRPKWGFEMPISKWLKEDLRFLLDEYLAKDTILKQGIFNYVPIESMKNDLVANRLDTSWQLWNLIVFQAWHERYGKN